MSKKLAAKASLIQMPAATAAGLETRQDAMEARIKTAPGSMAHFMATQSSAVKEAEELRERLKAYDGASAVRALDPRTVVPSRWANRHEDSYADAAFAELKAEIAAAGGNVQPACVRPVLNGSTPGAAGSEARDRAPVAYELVYGHRRHRACLELGLPLQAMLISLGDRELFETMERENRSRKNLSAWEQGRMYRRALDEGLYPSQRRLSEALGVDVSLVSKSLSLARLPDAVVQAFSSPLEIQFRWAQPLAEALQRDPEGVLARAQRVRPAAGTGMATMTAPQVLKVLLGGAEAPVLNRSTPGHRVIHGAAGRQALLSRDARGRVVLRFAAGVLSDGMETELSSLVEKLLSRP
jgi:ParB family transcriptional regulator, chromosome partitioning protein